MSRYGSKVDANHSEIRGALRRAGVIVFDSSHIGDGFPDLVALHRRTGVIVFLEVKDGAKPPSARRLTEAEEDFGKQFPVSVVLCVTEALAAVGLVAA